MLERPDSLNDTIVACATAPGEAAIAVVRLSGPDARAIADRLQKSPTPRESHRFYLRRLFDENTHPLDEAGILEMHAPRSYTGDDTVEFHLHGSRAIVQGVSDACIAFGARQARPGEFTLRAFLHGKLDLAQAEAVRGLIVSSNKSQIARAQAELSGLISQQISILIGEMERLLAGWQAALDFPEYEVGEDISADDLRVLEDVACKIQGLVRNARIDLGKPRRVVLCGAPNVGKSSLLNAWAGGKRVLVHAAPGTTRDPVEAELTEGERRWIVCDTAGIRDTDEDLEKAGIEMALDHIDRADQAIWLVGGDNPEWPPEFITFDGLIVGAKADLTDSDERRAVEKAAAAKGYRFWGWISPTHGEGIESLRKHLEGADDSARDGDILITRQRHLNALNEAAAGLERLKEAGDNGHTLDVLALELHSSVQSLGKILGRDVDEALIDRIFADFCIGK